MSDPDRCPRCGRPVLVRRLAGSSNLVTLDPEPSPRGTWMVTPTTAQTSTGGRGGFRYEAHLLTCKGAPDESVTPL